MTPVASLKLGMVLSLADILVGRTYGLWNDRVSGGRTTAEMRVVRIQPTPRMQEQMRTMAPHLRTLSLTLRPLRTPPPVRGTIRGRRSKGRHHHLRTPMTTQRTHTNQRPKTRGRRQERPETRQRRAAPG
ncbi:hypothetical protein B0H10DRAFT_1292423 [Mycena sp. CBHHK59/15]|nr:hypothetical protein B0H10DRAFT_1292423 [Mycena sp. CBHHK59/15]